MSWTAKRKRIRKLEREKHEDVYIIPVMGLPGAGKSSFINQLFGESVVKVGHRLQPCTVELQPIQIPMDRIQRHIPIPVLKDGSKLIIVDTPPCDEDTFDDSEILKRIADWLENTYGVGAKLAGFIYLQDICQRRPITTTKRDFDVFEKLCGPDACKSVVLGTTKWQKLHPYDITVAEEREEDLQDNFWRAMLEKGSTMHRVDDRDPNALPWKLIEKVLFKGKTGVLLVQEELMDICKILPQTEAAAVLRTRIEELIEELKNTGATKEELRALAREVEALKSALAKIMDKSHPHTRSPRIDNGDENGAPRSEVDAAAKAFNLKLTAEQDETTVSGLERTNNNIAMLVIQISDLQRNVRANEAIIKHQASLIQTLTNKLGELQQSQG